MRPVEIRIMALVETGIMGPVEAGSGVGCLDSVQPQATHRCVNRRLRRWERATATALRRGAAFRAQDGWRRQGWGCWKGQGCCIVRLGYGSAEKQDALRFIHGC